MPKKSGHPNFLHGDPKKFLDFVGRAGSVRRFHTFQCLFPEDVASHSWHVATLCFFLCRPAQPSANLLQAALFHDAAEYVTGDIPSPTKRLEPYFAEALLTREQDILIDQGVHVRLSTADKKFLEQADLLSLLWKCAVECRMGNSAFYSCFEKGAEYFMKLSPSPAARELYKEIHNYKNGN